MAIQLTECSCPACGNSQKKRLHSHLTDVEAKTEGQYGIAKCNNCNLIYLSPKPKEENLKDCYPDTYYTQLKSTRSVLSQKLYQPRYRFRKQRIEKACQGIPSSLLEIGYGDGCFLSYLRSAWGDRCELSGIDFRPPPNKEHLQGIDLAEGDFLQFHFEKTYDAIVMYDVLEHLPRPMEALNHLKQFLKPNGLLILQVPNWNSLFRLVFPKHWSGLQIPRHQIFLTRRSLGEMLKQTGFETQHFNQIFDPGDFSVSFCNWVSEQLQLKTPPRQSWFFIPTTVIFAFLSLLQCSLFRNSGEMELIACLPVDSHGQACGTLSFASLAENPPSSRREREGEAPSGFAGGGGDASPFNRKQLLNLPIDCLSMLETLNWIDLAIQKRKPFCQHTVVNAAKIVLAKRDLLLKQSILESDLVNVDGQAVVWAARLLKINVPEKVSGIDLMVALLKKSEEKKWRVFFLGATAKVLEQMLQRLQKKYPRLMVVGAHDGYFSHEESNTIVQEIKNAKPDILFVGMPTPKKENFIRDYKETIQVPFSMGVGGSFDILAGKTKRAPIWLQNAGLEWLFRLAQEPKRLAKRYLKTNTLFIYMVLREYFRISKKGK